MLINNQFSNRARIHPVENFDGTFLTGWRDTGEDRLRLVITECLGQNIADIVASTESKTSLFLDDGQKFVKYWMHGAHLLVEGKKMSKSLGNFFTLRDLLAKGSAGREVRYLMISAHYRETFNFTLDNLAGARTALGRIDECTAKLRELALGQAAATAADSPLVTRFTEAMDDDLNVSAAWAAAFDWVRDTNRKLAAEELDAAAAATELANWEKINSVLGIETVEEEAPAEILALAEERQAARKAKDFARSDQIRDELAAQGWVIEDTPKGPRVKRA